LSFFSAFRGAAKFAENYSQNQITAKAIYRSPKKKKTKNYLEDQNSD